jgi:GNAT superfamily N-acetyltransferase
MIRTDWVPSGYTENITIREATEADMPYLLQFEQGVITAERPFDPTIKEGDINYYDLNLMLTAPHIYLVVAELDGQPIGSGYARIEQAKKLYYKHKQHAYLGFMYVVPQHRGKGINKLVIETLKQWAISQKINELILEVYYDNAPAIKAYEKFGFSKNMIEMRMGL